ncbi:MAG: hemolysin III family protein [Oscillospiraceae bacterium]|nr:hemolysin III family protein [Oscillospiraceae bacterium]MDD4413627.1 hemolysin III family protein [Oscillospiraceae bacterium]
MTTDIQKKGSLYTLSEEIGHSITHGIGAMISIAGIVILLLRAGGRPLETVAAAVYGASMLLLFCMSSLYHAITNVKVKKVLRVLDHSSIFLMIAGTYTPYTLISLRGAIGWTIFGVVWATAIFGIILNCIGLEKFKKISMICYIASGWCIVVAAIPLFNTLPWNGLMLLLTGGVFYTSGLIFYRQKKVRYTHLTWHFFVLAGAVAHYFSILLYVL